MAPVVKEGYRRPPVNIRGVVGIDSRQLTSARHGPLNRRPPLGGLPAEEDGEVNVAARSHMPQERPGGGSR